ncbi:hypothetical protein [Bacteriovorax stolpii]|nr:hypothetical protein [Bacteriovorax stolpii]
MANSLMIKHYKDSYIYLFLYSILLWYGYHLIPSFEGTQKYPLLNTITAHGLLLLNAFIIKKIIGQLKSDEKIGFIAASLYIASPSHYDVFLFSSKIQFLFAEFFFLIFVLLFVRNHLKASFISLCISILLNTKLFIVPLLLITSKKTTKEIKIVSILTLSYFATQLVPDFHTQKQILTSGYKTFFYQAEIIFAPINLSIFNYGLLWENYPNLLTILIFFVLIIGCAFLKKTRNYLYFCVFLGFTTTFIPIKELIRSKNEFYYLFPSENPFIIFFILLLFSGIISEVKGKTIAILALVFNFYFLFLTLRLQSNTIDLMSSWNEAMSILKSPYPFEGKAKLKYAQLLYQNGELDKSLEVIEANRKTFPSIEWYDLALAIAGQRRDDQAIKNIHQQLIDERIPFILPESN